MAKLGEGVFYHLGSQLRVGKVQKPHGGPMTPIGDCCCPQHLEDVLLFVDQPVSFPKLGGIRDKVDVLLAGMVTAAPGKSSLSKKTV